jgi:hypothetical protein
MSLDVVGHPPKQKRVVMGHTERVITVGAQ